MSGFNPMGNKREDHKVVVALFVLAAIFSASIGYGVSRLISSDHNVGTPLNSQSRSRSRAATSGNIVLRGDGVGPARFGQRGALALAALVIALGPPSSSTFIDLTGDCTVDAVLMWPSFTAYFYHRHFVGYGYGDPGFGYGDGKTNHRQMLSAVSAKGLRLGNAITRARQIYGAAFVTSYAQGGSWSASTSNGRLDGYLNNEVQSRPAPQIASIGAGAVGCPAMSP